MLVRFKVPETTFGGTQKSAHDSEGIKPHLCGVASVLTEDLCAWASASILLRKPKNCLGSKAMSTQELEKAHS